MTVPDARRHTGPAGRRAAHPQRSPRIRHDWRGLADLGRGAARSGPARACPRQISRRAGPRRRARASATPVTSHSTPAPKPLLSPSFRRFRTDRDAPPARRRAGGCPAAPGISGRRRPQQLTTPPDTGDPGRGSLSVVASRISIAFGIYGLWLLTGGSLLYRVQNGPVRSGICRWLAASRTATVARFHLYYRNA
jgi:hypothetical protein